MNDITNPIEDRPWFKKRLVLATAAVSVLLILASAGLYFFPVKRNSELPSNDQNGQAPAPAPVPVTKTSSALDDSDECDPDERIVQLISKICDSAKQSSSQALITTLNPLLEASKKEVGRKNLAEMIFEVRRQPPIKINAYSYSHFTAFYDILEWGGMSVQGKANPVMTAESEFQLVRRGWGGECTEVENGKAIAMVILCVIHNLQYFVSKVENGWQTHTGKFISYQDIMKSCAINVILYQYTPPAL